MHGEKLFYQLHSQTTASDVICKYSGKRDPSEIERTHNIRKQQTQCCKAQTDQVPSSLLVSGVSDLFAGSFLRVTTELI